MQGAKVAHRENARSSFDGRRAVFIDPAMLKHGFASVSGSFRLKKEKNAHLLLPRSRLQERTNDKVYLASFAVMYIMMQ